MLEFISFVYSLVAYIGLVLSLEFILVPTRVELGTQGRQHMTCDVTETDVSKIYDMQIRREKDGSWEIVALMEHKEACYPVLKVQNDKDFVVGGFLNTTYHVNTHLTLDMNIAKMTGSDSRKYNCKMQYLSKTSGKHESVERNAILFIDDPEIQTERQADKSCTDASDIVGGLLGVANVLTISYAAYLTVLIRRNRKQSSDDRRSHYVTYENEPLEQTATRSIQTTSHLYSDEYQDSNEVRL